MGGAGWSQTIHTSSLRCIRSFNDEEKLCAARKLRSVTVMRETKWDEKFDLIHVETGLGGKSHNYEITGYKYWTKRNYERKSLNYDIKHS